MLPFVSLGIIIPFFLHLIMLSPQDLSLFVYLFLIHFFFQATRHFRGSLGSKLHSMLPEDWNTFMNTQRIIMSIETLNQVISCLMVPSEQRLADLNSVVSFFFRQLIASLSFAFTDFRFWACKTSSEIQRRRGFCH